MTLRLRNFDLAPFMQVAERMGYVVEGRTNGAATMKSVLHGGEISADILLDSLEVNDIPAPPLRLSSRWDFSRNRAGVTVTDRNKRDTLIRGFYAPSQVRYYARLDIDSLDMGLLDPVLSGVISQTEGLASAELVLQGQRRDADLTGRIHVRGLSTKVDFTQVAYSMPEAVLDVRGNRFRASNVPVFDPEGNRGRFDIDLSLQHLSNIAYDVRVAPQQMLVLNTTAQDNDFFYGKVYASGTARISGDKGAVNMDIAASTDDHSSFFMPLSNKSNISYADFVTFKEKPKADTVDNLARRKMMFERRRQQKTVAGSQMDIALALNVRPGVEVEPERVGQYAQGPRRRNAQPADQSPLERLRDVRRLYHHRRELPFLAPEHHQQEVHHRKRLDDPVDRFADGRHAQYRRHLQVESLAAAAAAGHGRKRDGRPLGARRVHHPPRRPAFEPGHHLRRERARHRP